MFATPAFAQSAEGAGTAFTSFIPLILIFVIMYFLLIRPQQKKVREHREMVTALRRGDQIVTQGGLIGKVTKVKEDNELEVEIAPGVKARVVRSTVSQVLSKTEPTKNTGSKPKRKSDKGPETKRLAAPETKRPAGKE